MNTNQPEDAGLTPEAGSWRLPNVAAGNILAAGS